MNFDLSVKEDRQKFVLRVMSLLEKGKTNVSLTDESNRTLNQNSYLHVLCRIMANETGVSTDYAKQIYFKKLANRELFCYTSTDTLTGKTVNVTRSTGELTVPQMQQAITNFRNWAAEQGYYLPSAFTDDSEKVTFTSKKDAKAFHKAEIELSKTSID